MLNDYQIKKIEERFSLKFLELIEMKTKYTYLFVEDRFNSLAEIRAFIDNYFPDIRWTSYYLSITTYPFYCRFNFVK